MEGRKSNSVVHLELQSVDPPAASAHLRALCGWSHEAVRTGCGRPYLALDLAPCLSGGIAQAGPSLRAAWLPYVEVDEIFGATAAAHRLGAEILLGPREGPAGWRSVVALEPLGPIAFYQPKRATGSASLKRTV